MTEPTKTVIVVRKDLELLTGKWIAQAVHAAMCSATMRVRVVPYDLNVVELPVCIVCYVKSEKQLLTLVEKAKASGVPWALQKDAGHNFVEPNTPTVLCIGPAPTSEVDSLTKNLQLLK